MKIKKVKVHNLYSYYDAEFDLDDYNVIVGPNGSGKTNIVRILKLLIENQLLSESNVIDKALNRIRLSKSYRFNDNEYSYVLIKLSLTKYETKVILQSLFDREIDENKIPTELYINILVYWTKPIKEEEEPSYVMCRFDNSSILFRWDKSIPADDFLIHINRIDLERIINDYLPKNRYMDINNIMKEEVREDLKHKGKKLEIHNLEAYLNEPILTPIRPSENENVEGLHYQDLRRVLIYEPSNPSKQAQDIIDLKYLQILG